jgi:hypothetical protein
MRRPALRARAQGPARVLGRLAHRLVALNELDEAGAAVVMKALQAKDGNLAELFENYAADEDAGFTKAVRLWLKGR